MLGRSPLLLINSTREPMAEPQLARIGIADFAKPPDNRRGIFVWKHVQEDQAMTSIRIVAFASIMLMTICMVQTVVHSAKPEAGVYGASLNNTGLISAPVFYRDTMLIAVTDQGVAAIVFQEKDAQLVNSSARYRFRYLKDSESEELAGEGIVLDTVNDKERLTVKAGPIRVGWSGSGHDRDWVYYNPDEMLLCIAKADRFDDSIWADVPGPPHRVQKIDLKRFLKARD